MMSVQHKNKTKSLAGRAQPFRYSLLASLLFCGFSTFAQTEQITVKGLVTDASGKPVADAKIHVHGRQQFVYTNKNGEFQLSAPAGAELHVAAKGFGDSFVKASPAPVAVSLTAGGIERIRVSASGLHHYDLEMATPVNVLAGDSLARHRAPTIGETLKMQPGVHSNYYGPVASSPVIRGLDGPRVKMLSNGLDTADVSRIGPDHSITADAITTEQIEVLRGPSTLLYGSGAIGGVVNIVDNRIPRQLRAPQTTLDASFNDVASEKSYALNHDGAHEQFAWHVDAMDRNADDFKVPTFTNDEGETASELHNTWLDNSAFNVGGSIVQENAWLVFPMVISKTNTGSQVIITTKKKLQRSRRAEDAGVFADMEQDRYGLTAELYNPFQGIEQLNFSSAYTDYQHAEVEDGIPGTKFTNETFEARLTAEHADIANWHGLIGVHHQTSDFAATGEEAFTPASKTNSLALFVLEERSFGDVKAQLGTRLERTRHSVDELTVSDELTVFDADTSLNAISASAGVVWNFQPGFNWTANISHSSRVPSASEIYANGLHIATSSYELGAAYQIAEDGELELAANKPQREVANNLDIGFHKVNGDLTFSYNFFYNRIDDYLYQADSGFTMEDLHSHDEGGDEGDHAHEDYVVYQYQQNDVDMYGMEFSLTYRVNQQHQVQAFADSVRIELRDGGNLPRVSPVKFGVEYQYEVADWQFVAGATRYAAQNRIAAEETKTPGYTLFDVSINYEFALENVDLTAYLRGNNLTDELAYVHTSFLKEDVPLPGRALSLGLTARF